MGSSSSAIMAISDDVDEAHAKIVYDGARPDAPINATTRTAGVFEMALSKIARFVCPFKRDG